MKKIILLIILSAIFCLDVVTEFHNNGLPKIVKTYNDYPKLVLTKEIRYFPNGQKLYQKKYINGKLTNFQEWDRVGNKLPITSNQNKLYCEEKVTLFGEIYDVETTRSINLRRVNSEIPKDIGCLTNLVELRLDRCGLYGEIPSELGRLVNLEYLDLEDNHLTGEIPKELGNLVKLRYFDLENNKLYGDIPDNVIELVKLIKSNDGKSREFVSFIKNDLNNNHWINEHACGDCRKRRRK